jgi:hypothetical protein
VVRIDPNKESVSVLGLRMLEIRPNSWFYGKGTEDLVLINISAMRMVRSGLRISAIWSAASYSSGSGVPVAAEYISNPTSIYQVYEQLRRIFVAV